MVGDLGEIVGRAARGYVPVRFALGTVLLVDEMILPVSLTPV